VRGSRGSKCRELTLLTLGQLTLISKVKTRGQKRVKTGGQLTLLRERVKRVKMQGIDPFDPGSIDPYFKGQNERSKEGQNRGSIDPVT